MAPARKEEAVSQVTRVCGGFGTVDAARVATMARLAGDPPVHVEQPDLILYGHNCAARNDPTGAAFAWAIAGPPASDSAGSPWVRTARDHDACGVVRATDGTVTLHGGVSGAQPLYVQATTDAVYFSTDLSWLVASAPQPLEPDWHAWAEIIAMGAPIAGRTTFAGLARIGPMEYVEHAPHRAPSYHRAEWPWLAIEPDPMVAPDDLTGDLLDALRAEIRPLVTAADAKQPVHPMLSGGRDSRLLTMLTQELAPPDLPVTAWSTSSDTGTSMEELVAARVATSLDIDHRIVAARHDQFTPDVTDYAKTVYFQGSFHIWLMPVARTLSQAHGTILDGLGGGVFLGGGFPDDPALAEISPTPAQIVDSRFHRLTRYLDAAPAVLQPGVADHLKALMRDDFTDIATPLAEHPNGATFTAYLTRTMPGIALAPAKVLAASRPTAMPIMADPVMSIALRTTHAHKRDGAWYPDLLTSANPSVGAIPTAADLSKRRQHIRRGGNAQAASWYRDLILDSPVRDLLSTDLRNAGLQTWSTHLGKTRPQHLLRGLAFLALWLREEHDKLTSSGIRALQAATATSRGPS